MNIDKKVEEFWGDVIFAKPDEMDEETEYGIVSDGNIKKLILEVQKETAREMVEVLNDTADTPHEAYKQIIGENYE